MISSTNYPGKSRIINSRTLTRFQDCMKAECRLFAVFLFAGNNTCKAKHWFWYYIRYP